MVEYHKIREKVEKISKQEEETAQESQSEVDNMKDGMFTIPIIGEIGWDVTADGINAQLDKADGQEVVFEVASPGGSVYDGIEIFNAIRNYKGKKTAKLIGLAASMASYIPLATDKVLAEDNAIYMIHNAWTIAMGDSEALKAESEVLESINETIAQAYVTKTGKSEKEVLKMMSDETWMFGDEIKKEGFVDEMIVHKDSDKKTDKDAKANLVSEAKVKVKDMFLKLQKERMSQDIGKINQSRGGISKMKEEKVSKLEDIEAVRSVVGKLRELAKKKEIKAEDVTKVAEELEAAIVVSSTNTPPADKKEEAGKDADATTDEGAEANTGDDKDKDKDKDAEDKDADKDKDADSEEGKDADKDATDEAEGADKDKDKDADADSDDAKDDKEDETSKQSDIQDGYKKVADDAVSKLQEVNKLYKAEKDKNEALTKENIKLSENISKFKQDSHNELVDSVVDEISKFKELNDDQKVKEKEQISKLSDEALVMMKAKYAEVNVSKLEDTEDVDTTSSENLEEDKDKDQGAGKDDSVSKMVNNDVKKAIGRYTE